MHSFSPLTVSCRPVPYVTPVSADASWAVTNTHGLYDTAAGLARVPAWAWGGVDVLADVGVPVGLSAVFEPLQAATTESNRPIHTKLIFRNMTIVSLPCELMEPFEAADV
jgi:hypothetical protein